MLREHNLLELLCRSHMVLGCCLHLEIFMTTRTGIRYSNVSDWPFGTLDKPGHMRVLGLEEAMFKEGEVADSDQSLVFFYTITHLSRVKSNCHICSCPVTGITSQTTKSAEFLHCTIQWCGPFYNLVVINQPALIKAEAGTVLMNCSEYSDSCTIADSCSQQKNFFGLNLK